MTSSGNGIHADPLERWTMLIRGYATRPSAIRLRGIPNNKVRNLDGGLNTRQEIQMQPERTARCSRVPCRDGLHTRVLGPLHHAQRVVITLFKCARFMHFDKRVFPALRTAFIRLSFTNGTSVGRRSRGLRLFARRITEKHPG